MVEVFKTDVGDAEAAKSLLKQIHENFNAYRANFDLSDCDHILRVQCALGTVCALSIIELLQKNGYWAEILPDEVPTYAYPSFLLPHNKRNKA
jgi:hypothetical protein